MTYDFGCARIRAVAAGMICLLALTAGAQDRSGMTLTLGSDEITVTGVPRGGRLVAFGIGIDQYDHGGLLTRYVKLLSDDDGDGIITFRPRPLSRRAVWLAIDVDSGEHVLATPKGVVPAGLDVRGAWRGGRSDFEVSSDSLEALVVRPGVGAWTLQMGDGGPNDADRLPDGILTLRLDRMERLAGEEKGPPFVLPRDVIVVIHPRTLRTFVSEAQ